MPFRARRRTPAALAGLLLPLLVLVVPAVAAADASAHDAVVGSTPASGATLTTPPAQVRVTLAEPPTAVGLGIAVRAPDGQQVAVGRPAVDGNDVVATLPVLSLPGSYTVAWRVVAADGHPVTGTFTFVLAGQTSASAVASAPSDAGPAQEDPPVIPTAVVAGVVALGAIAAVVVAIVVARRRT